MPLNFLAQHTVTNSFVICDANNTETDRQTSDPLPRFGHDLSRTTSLFRFYMAISGANKTIIAFACLLGCNLIFGLCVEGLKGIWNS